MAYAACQQLRDIEDLYLKYGVAPEWKRALHASQLSTLPYKVGEHQRGRPTIQ